MADGHHERSINMVECSNNYYDSTTNNTSGNQDRSDYTTSLRNTNKVNNEDAPAGVSNPSFLKDESIEHATNKTVGVSGNTGCGMSEQEVRKEKLAIVKNLLVLSIVFVCLFTSYNTVANLQSSLNRDMGTTALAALYTAMVVSCCLLPTWTLRVLGEKTTLFVSSACYCGYMVAQFHPRLYTLVPSALLVGAAAAPLWSAKSTYLTKVAERYAQLSGQNTEVVITRFFGIFFLFFQSTNIWGNLISSSVLSIGVEEVSENNETDDLSFSSCGYHYCISATNVSTSSSSSQEVKELTWQHYIIFSVFLGFGVCSSLVVLLIDPLTRFVKKEHDKVEGKSEVRQLMLATFSHMRHPYQLLLLPLTVWSGLEQQFLSTDYTAAYVTCSIGIHNLGYVLIAYGVSDSLSCLAIASLMKRVGRVPGFVLAFILNLCLIFVFIYWSPRPEHLPWFYVFAALWGVSDAVWQTQINALYSVIFPSDSTPAAFSNYRLWESLGMLIAYCCSTILCVDDKIAILLGFLLVGMLGYLIVEITERKGGLRTDEQGKVVPIDELISRCFLVFWN